MSIFRLEPYGYRRHENNFEFRLEVDGDEVSIESGAGSGMLVHCKTFKDDFSNGSGEFIIDGFNVNDWYCDYVRVYWNWNYGDGFIMITKDFQPMSVKVSFSYGIAQNNLESLCKSYLKSLVKEALKLMRDNNSPEDMLKSLLKRVAK